MGTDWFRTNHVSFMCDHSELFAEDDQAGTLRDLLDLGGFGFELGNEFVHLVDNGLDGVTLAQIYAGFAELVHRVVITAAAEKRELTVGRRFARGFRSGGHCLHQLGRRSKTGRVLKNVVR